MCQSAGAPSSNSLFTTCPEVMTLASNHSRAPKSASTPPGVMRRKGRPRSSSTLTVSRPALASRILQFSRNTAVAVRPAPPGFSLVTIGRARGPLPWAPAGAASANMPAQTASATNAVDPAFSRPGLPLRTAVRRRTAEDTQTP